MRGGWTRLDLIRRLELLPGLAVNTYLCLATGAQSQRSYLLTSFMLVLLSCPIIPS
jgi:hypothetical protein